MYQVSCYIFRKKTFVGATALLPTNPLPEFTYKFTSATPPVLDLRKLVLLIEPRTMEDFADPEVAHAAEANPVDPAVQIKSTVPVDAISAYKQRVADVQPQPINPFVLPVELWLIIFGFLDETTQAIAMHVCHEWHALIMNISGIPRIFEEDLARSVSLLVWQQDFLGQPLSDNTCHYAAKGGHLDVLQYARANGCLWDMWTCTLAAKGGHLDILQWAHANGCPWDEDTCAAAAEKGYLQILQYAHANGCPWDSFTCLSAAKGGHLHILKYARDTGCPWNSFTCSSAAKGGHLDILQWAHANGCTWDKYTCSFAAMGGHLDILQYLVANGCLWDEETCAFAAKGGHLDILQWAHDNGCPWSSWTCTLAKHYGHQDILQYARANNCPESM